MSDKRLSVTDGCSLCKCPVGGVLPPAGRFRLWGDALSLARRGARGYSWVEGMVHKWLVLLVCGALTATVW